jgi:L,D-peptidoglycan transpeptidase YkuD (ErfK/YbiS/YcfS/YnhG family)
VRNRGSAIFMHIARPDFAPTEGCVALRRADLLRLLSRLPRHAEIVIG